MEIEIETVKKLKYIMIYSILFDETDRVREYATSEGNLIIPPEALNCLYGKALRVLPLKQGISLEDFCRFFDNELTEILYSKKTLGFSLKDFRALVDLSNCSKIPKDTPNRANITILQGDVQLFVEENFYLIMSILLYNKARCYREYFETIKPVFSAPRAEKKHKNNGDSFGAIYSIQSILSIMNFLDCFMSVVISDNNLEQKIEDGLKKMRILLNDSQYIGTTKHKVMQKGFLLLNNFDLSDFNNKWQGFKTKYTTLDNSIAIRHNITHFDSNTNKSFIYSKSNTWLNRAEIMVKEICVYSLHIWQAIHGNQSFPKYLGDLNYDKLITDFRYKVYKELEYSNEVHEYMKNKFNYTD